MPRDINPLFQIEANVSAFQRLSGSPLSLSILPTVISGSNCVQITEFFFDCAVCKCEAEHGGHAFNTVCFINAVMA